MDNKFTEYNCIGILGGTFNPVHNGHIMLAKKVIEQYNNIEQLFLMPNNSPAYKDNNHIITSEHRLRMLELATYDIPKTSVSDMEIKRGGITYTIDTLKQIKSINPTIKIYFIIGADSLYNIEKWHKFKEIFDNCTIIAAKRDCDMTDIINYSQELCNKYPNLKISFLQTDSINISSSELRNNIKSGVFDMSYLDDKVIQYIKNYNLYGWNL